MNSTTKNTKVNKAKQNVKIYTYKDFHPIQVVIDCGKHHKQPPIDT